MAERIDATYRPMALTDIAATTYIKKAALESIPTGAMAPRSPWEPSYPRMLEHLLRTDSAGSVVAEIDGLVVGYAQALIRGDIWFLSQLFVQPEAHGRGIGDQLLDRAKQYGRENGARIYAVVSTAQPVSQSLYMRHGMFATAIGYGMSGDLEPLRALPDPPASTKRIVDCTGWLDRMADLDRKVFGADRRQDHEFFLAGDGSSGEVASFGLTEGSDFLGYGYAVADGGFIAPLAAQEPAYLLPLLKTGAEWLLDRDVKTGLIWAVSHNKTMIGALLSAGWRTNFWSFLMASEPFGQFDHYHPSGGVLL
jgi:GNAT superfamily N-acetyltransferase